jgi:hypothetical protein
MAASMLLNQLDPNIPMKNKDVEGKLISQNVIYSQWSTGCPLWLLVLLRCNQFAGLHCHFDTGCTCHCIHNSDYSPHDTASSVQSDISPSEARSHAALSDTSSTTQSIVKTKMSTSPSTGTPSGKPKRKPSKTSSTAQATA